MDSIVTRDPEDLAATAAGIVASEIRNNERLTLGVAGGSTPRATHTAIEALDLDWSGVTAWIPDERWVPPDHADSNQRMARESLTDVVGARLIAPDTLRSTPTEAAREYGDVIVPLVTDRTTRSVTMLGIGTDGHTASLFPGTRAADITGVSYVANFVPPLDAWRLTATRALLSASHIVIFLVCGAAKASTVAAIAAGEDLPATRIRAKERVLWILDEAAASKLDR